MMSDGNQTIMLSPGPVTDRTVNSGSSPKGLLMSPMEVVSYQLSAMHMDLMVYKNL